MREWCYHCAEPVERAEPTPMHRCVHERTGLEVCTSPRGDVLGTIAAPTTINPDGDVTACELESEFPAFKVTAQVIGFRAECRVAGFDVTAFGLTAEEMRDRLVTLRGLVYKGLARAIAVDSPGWRVWSVETWRGPRLMARRQGWPTGTCALMTDDPEEMRRELKEAG
jgi:hypothetical protein